MRADDVVAGLPAFLPYLRKFHDSIFVVKLGGEMCEGGVLRSLCTQLAVLYFAGVKVVLVHGGGPQLDALTEQLGIERKVIGGRRVTDEATLKAAAMVFGGIQTEVVAQLRSNGVPAVGVSGVDAGLIVAKRRPPVKIVDEAGLEQIVDFGFVGDIEKINAPLLEALLRNQFLPVVSSLGFDELGSVVNINADTIASQVAQSLKASKLIVVSNVPGVLLNPSDEESVIDCLETSRIEELIAEGVIRGGMLPKVQACVRAVTNGVPRTHIIKGSRENSLLAEVFLSQGSGTMIVSPDQRERYEAEGI